MATAEARTDLQKRHAYIRYEVRADKPGSSARKRILTRQASARFFKARPTRTHKLAVGDAILNVEDAQVTVKQHIDDGRLFCDEKKLTPHPPSDATELQVHQTHLASLTVILAPKMVPLVPGTFSHRSRRLIVHLPHTARRRMSGPPVAAWPG